MISQSTAAAWLTSSARVVQWAKSEAHDVGRTEIADHAARDQRLHRGVALGVAERDLAAAGLRVARLARSGRGSRCLDFRDERSESSMERARISAIVTPSKMSSAASSAAIWITGGVPTRIRLMPSPGR
jgi:hypothetical protein